MLIGFTNLTFYDLLSDKFMGLGNPTDPHYHIRTTGSTFFFATSSSNKNGGLVLCAALLVTFLNFYFTFIGHCLAVCNV
jgi:hypothetical protein